jgi:hypothetical protein
MYPLFLSDINETWILSTEFRESLKYQISLKSDQCEPSCFMQTDGHDEANNRFSFLRTRLKRVWEEYTGSKKGLEMLHNDKLYIWQTSKGVEGGMARDGQDK